MSKVTLGGNPIDVAGRVPQAGEAAPIGRQISSLKSSFMSACFLT